MLRLGMKILLTIRSCARRKDSLQRTLISLQSNFSNEFDGIEGVSICLNDDLTPNQNALTQIDRLTDQDWIVMSEDDLEWCADPLGSMSRWLEDFALPDVMVYRFFAFDHLEPLSAHVGRALLREMKGSQVVALRADDARRFAAWARQHPLDWRPKGAPFQDQPHTGFDKLIGYWALQDRPAVKHGLVSRPFFVRHLGRQSSIHARAIHRDAEFAGTSWSYRSEVMA